MIFAVQNGSFGYGSRPILNDISFEVQSGEVLTILGPNGVGKTTLLKCMMGLLKWKKGESFLDQVTLGKIPHKQLWRNIAYVPQAKTGVFSYTALDMVLLGRSAHLGTFAQPKKEDYEIAVQAMDEVGVSYLKDKLCTKMSGGELQMVLIARALTINPKMLILDEPESNLDFKNQIIILDTIKKLSKERNISSVVNTHYPAHALKIADKALILTREGTNFYGATDDVITEENMKKAFSVNVRIEEFHYDQRPYKSEVPICLI